MVGRMRWGLVLGAAMLGVWGAVGAPAAAQDVFDGDGPRWGRGPAWDRPLDWNRGPRLERGGILPPRAIVGSLYRRGYRDVEIRGRRGPNYVAEASGRRGRVLVVVDARSAEITGLKVLDWDRPRRLYDDGGWSGPSPWSGPRW
jgi:hypothetical protein